MKTSRSSFHATPPSASPATRCAQDVPTHDRGLRMTVEFAPYANATVGRISGDIDVLAAPSFALALAHLIDGGSFSRVVVDMTAVDFVGTSGLSILSEFAESARRQHITWALAGNRAVLRPIEAIGLSATIPTCSTVHDAFDKVEKISHS
ncbi:STAS domain-containing protein [Rhodococcus sp. NPDC057014]|uniref:STAS domain-containing protein n=1 Tax=unclassified Rhodococcus (in: high G+C Gram-positive bacteria) TaxID=192944 RepID=UPI0036293A17